MTYIVASCAEQQCCLIRGRYGACHPLLSFLVLTVALHYATIPTSNHDFRSRPERHRPRLI
jgi:hypothetical protein